jgi:polyisoprenoid-binding protein YceI
MEGDIEIREIKKHVVLDCTGPVGPVTEDERKIKRLGFTAKTTINRKDFGIKWNREVSKGVFMVADNVDITLEIELMKEPGVE